MNMSHFLSAGVIILLFGLFVYAMYRFFRNNFALTTAPPSDGEKKRQILVENAKFAVRQNHE